MAGSFILDSIKISEAFRVRFSDVLENEVDSSDLCFPKEDILARHNELTSGLEQNLQRAENRLGYIFEEGLDHDTENNKTIETLDCLSDEQGDPVSLYSMALFATHKFGVPLEQEELIFPLLAAAVLGEIEHDLPYHNNFHFRKVMLHAIRLITVHNRLFENKKRELDAQSICKLLTAALIHDLGHDGKNNYIDGNYEFARLELRSFDLFLPVLNALSVPKEFISDVMVMLITTDVLPFGHPMSPANQMSAAYDYHFGMSSEDLPELSSELAILEERQDLTIMCMMLHAADLMNSMGLSYEVTKCESFAVNKEIGKEKTTPDDIWLFLNKICQNPLMLEAAQILAEKPMQEIYRQVRDDVSASVSSIKC
ncbi:MAG: HD domain-containing protein [Alphaproteobacteria bacterium]|nr:HD domain-containing protein [Alphaproteobacteria bacterium]